jgi:hypothetical protein
VNARRHLIAALSEDSMGGIATLSDVEHAEQLVDAHRAEVLREGADAINALPQDYECDPGRGDAAELLRVMAEASREKSSRETADATPGEDYPGELARLRTLVRELRVALRNGNALAAWKLIEDHTVADAAAREAVTR